MTPAQRYEAAHELFFKREYPNAYKDGHYINAVCPDVRTSNGLQSFITRFIMFSGYRATRINVEGRLEDKLERQPESGTVLRIKKWKTSATRKGTADVSSTISGRAVMWEVKIGRDKPSENQLREQAREVKAGGHYYFIKTPEEFLERYDQLLFIFGLSPLP